MTERVTFAGTATMDGNTLVGVVHLFGQLTKRDGRYIAFAPGAFDKALETSDTRAFVNHDTTLLLGRRTNGTVRVSADSKALRAEIDLPNTTYANDLRALVERGDLAEFSFGVSGGQIERSQAPDGLPLHTFTTVDELFDVSPVSVPAFAGTSAQLHERPFGRSRSQMALARYRALTRKDR